jgi:hypothetical protein
MNFFRVQKQNKGIGHRSGSTKHPPVTGTFLLGRFRIVHDFLTKSGSKSPIIAATPPVALSKVAMGKEAIAELAQTTKAIFFAEAKLPKADGDALVEVVKQLFVIYRLFAPFFHPFLYQYILRNF